jgi:hypothetical protein
VIGVESCEEVYDLSFCFALLRVDLGVLVLARDWPADSPKGRFLFQARKLRCPFWAPTFVDSLNWKTSNTERKRQRGYRREWVGRWWKPFQRRSHAWGWKPDDMKENDHNQ